MDCVFCQIATGELPTDPIYQNNKVIAFAPLDPVSVGHTLIAPKAHYENLADITVELLCDVMEVAKSIAMDLLVKNCARGINLLHASGRDAEQSILHFHIHVVPRYPRDGLELCLKNRA
jgi:histidine triad (HIT) family protein